MKLAYLCIHNVINPEMKFFKRIRAWWRGLFRKRRFNMLNATDNSEEWHIHLSPASVFAGLPGVRPAAVHPHPVAGGLQPRSWNSCRDTAPRPTVRAKASLQNIIRLDSMERMMNDMLTYNQQHRADHGGQNPVARTLATSDVTRTSKVLVMPSPEDSILRAQMEGDGPYAIAGRSGGSRRSVREAIELAKPVEGIITERFDITTAISG